MHTLITMGRIGLTLVLLSSLMWLPGKIAEGSNWWGPIRCCGQETAEPEPSPENPGAGSYAGNDFPGQVSILNNVVNDSNGFYRAHLRNAFQGFTGMAQVNQAAGMLNNQATYIGLAGLGEGASGAGLRLNYVSRVQYNSLSISNNSYQTHIQGPSFAGGAGLTLVNQAAGHLNAQLTAFFLAVGTNAAHDLTDLQLGAINSNNTLTPDPKAPSLRSAKLELDKGAFQNYTGIWGTSQIAGNLNQVTTIFNVRVTTVP
jgi:hypothetical protein